MKMKDRDFRGKTGQGKMKEEERHLAHRAPNAHGKGAEREKKTPVGTVPEGLSVGRNAVRELLRSGRTVDKILVQSGEREGALIPLVGEAIARGIPVVETNRAKLDLLAGGTPHQGVIAMAAEKEYVTVAEILAIAAAFPIRTISAPLYGVPRGAARTGSLFRKGTR